ncbi:cystathionine beta-lyase [Kordiimonas sp. SCSIO 12610]|uniref:cystathionine beta-lyase n=1 Tax=Kordiimonas sp. SCSIO 12610 TaxID=2829597 RepID=UPI00210A7168|nr:cystathionine beta-lyase [Kordiimonas sp. SCSIO 12610]UTW56633.1 cystathionine beta-lyase [Kordiimonas sp. SCSIO 12610]
MSDKQRDTKLVTAGRRKEWTHGIVNPPVYRASTCLFDSYAEMRERVKDPSARHLFYGRKGTPTQWALEDAITELENGEGTMLFPSGVAAVNAAILACVKTGDHILITDSAYDPTRSFANGFLKKMGITTEYYDPTIGANIESLIKDNTAMILVESPGSLTFEVQDLPAISAVAKRHNILIVSDSTWGTPLYFPALELGADISVHACTKYIGGHSDIMLGSATANHRMFKRLRQTAYSLGQTVSADDAALGLRGLRTLGVRLKQHEENALLIAKWLQDHPLIHEVRHPALETSPGHDIWSRDFTGSTGLFSIILKYGDYPDTAHLVDEMKYFKMGFSWGGYESLILPSDPESARSASKWSSPGPLLRLHIGLEDTDDLMKDLEAGLQRYSDAVKP